MKLFNRFVAVLFTACALLVFTESAKADYVDISAEEAYKLIQEKKNDSSYVIIDVRTPEEREDDGFIPNSVNLNIGDEDFVAKVSKLDVNKNYIMHCKSGVRGRRALETFQKAGIKNVYHIKDGYNGYGAYLKTLK